jgi:hypothetical protein
LPQRLRRQFGQTGGEGCEAVLIGKAGRQRDLDLGDQFGDLDQAEAQGVELGVTPER